MHDNNTRWPYRVRLYWADIEAALAMLRHGAKGAFKATLDGNFPVIDCEDERDAAALLSTYPPASARQ